MERKGQGAGSDIGSRRKLLGNISSTVAIEGDKRNCISPNRRLYPIFSKTPNNISTVRGQCTGKQRGIGLVDVTASALRLRKLQRSGTEQHVVSLSRGLPGSDNALELAEL